MPFVLAPISFESLIVVSIGAFYIPHIIMMFTFFGVFFRLYGTNRLKHFILIALLYAISFLLGLSGLRYMLILNIPLLASCFWLLIKSDGFTVFSRNVTRENFNAARQGWSFRTFLVSAIALIIAVFGYFCNANFLSKIYSFGSQNDIEMLNMKHASFFDRLEGVITGFFDAAGYRNGVKLLSADGVLAILLLVLIVVTAYCAVKVLRNKDIPLYQRMLALFFVFSLIINTLVFIFIDIDFSSRYYLLVFIFTVPVIAIYLQNEKIQLMKLSLGLLIFLTIVFAGINTVKLQSEADVSGNEKRAGHMEYLLANQFDFGYATFWNADILTELSNGRIDVVALMPSLDILKFQYWLAPKAIYEKGYSEGKAFLLLSREEYRKFKNELSILEKMEKVYNDDDYFVFVCDDVKDIEEYFIYD